MFGLGVLGRREKNGTGNHSFELLLQRRKQQLNFTRVVFLTVVLMQMTLPLQNNWVTTWHVAPARVRIREA